MQRLSSKRKSLLSQIMMSIMNSTIQIASLYDCGQLSQYTGIVNSLDPIWRQTVAGCKILNILRDMYGFKVSYVFEDLEANLVGQSDPKHISSTVQNQSIDMYLRPMSLRVQHLKDMVPLQAAYSWKLGFLLRRRDQYLYSRFYSKPFSRPVWNCLYFTALFISILFYFLKKWEFKVIGGWECSYPYELLMVIGGYCQHIPPIEATLPSRRIAYFSFLIFAYTIYTYYTSNLMSALVNDKGDVITLTNLVKTDIEYVIVDYMTLTISENVPTTDMHYGLITEKLKNLRSVSLLEGLQGVKDGTVAVLSDYTSIFPIVKKTFDNEEVCDIMSVDLFSQIKKYFFVSKHFQYKEQFKVGALRAKEVGIFKRLLETDYEELDCLPAALVQTSITQISVPILILLMTYVSSVLILFAERAYYNYNHKLWPYVE